MTNPTFCAAPGCATHDEHYPTCTNPNCTGCWPRPANHGHLCQTHYERVDYAFTVADRLRDLDETLHGRLPTNDDATKGPVDGAFDGNGYARAITPASDNSTIAGPRIPLTPLQLDLDAIDRAAASYPGSLDSWVATEPGAIDASNYANFVHRTERAHPTAEAERKLNRLRCPSCNLLTATWQPPTWPGDEVHITCIKCGWKATNPDAINIVADIEIRGRLNEGELLLLAARAHRRAERAKKGAA